ncbi:hypothetical protein QE152_g15837 [Popillia japonica]|uniref:Uncharacterized protein n=1 Tax=Popillia japonica TaxID=7064 RepID=A0AAW1L6F3_POPJA
MLLTKKPGRLDLKRLISTRRYLQKQIYPKVTATIDKKKNSSPYRVKDSFKTEKERLSVRLTAYRLDSNEEKETGLATLPHPPRSRLPNYFETVDVYRRRTTIGGLLSFMDTISFGLPSPSVLKVPVQ